jgi:outer membrane protein OmpA-like peptidoglycan-associated protein
MIMQVIMALLCWFALACGALLAGKSRASAADASTADIVCALDPKCTRPLTRDVRGVTVTKGPDGAAPLSVNLYVNFAYDSAELTSDARITLDRLGYALVDDRLKSFNFMIEGHTDAKGSDEYNQKLSERRAEGVRQYLMAQFGIDAPRVTARGFGKTRLFDPSRPEDGVNRRVQVLNLTAAASSGR